MTAQELRLYTLRRLHELAEANGYHYLVSLDEIAAEVGVDDRLKVLSLGQDLEADSLVTLSATQGGTKAAIKMRGVQVIEEALSNPRPKTVSIKAAQDVNGSLDSLLHPVIREHAYPQYLDGHWRDAVLNAFIAVFDLIRNRTGLDLDGDALVTRAFSLQRPMLMLSDLRTESGRNDQAGFLQIYQGSYKGIRNPKAHGLQHDLTDNKAAQYLVFASLLARRVEEATLAESEPSF